MLILLLPFGWTISKYLIAMVIMEEFDFLIVEQSITFESLSWVFNWLYAVIQNFEQPCNYNICNIQTYQIFFM